MCSVHGVLHQDILGLVGDTIELLRATFACDDGDALDLEPSRVLLAGRSRRVSNAYKNAVVLASRANTHLETPQQIVAAQHLNKRFRLQGVRLVSACKFLKSHRIQYMMKGRHVLKRNKWAHVGCDGGTIHGAHWLVILGWSVEQGLGFWQCPQALRISRVLVP